MTTGGRRAGSCALQVAFESQHAASLELEHSVTNSLRADPLPCAQVDFVNAALLGWHRLDRGFLDGVEDLFGNLRVKRRVAVERNHHPASALCVIR